MLENGKNMMWLLNQPPVPLVDSQMLHLLLKVVWASGHRSGELDVSKEQTADCNTRGHLRKLCCQFPLFIWTMLPFSPEPFFTVWFIFLFLHLFTCFHSFISCWSCTSRKLPPWTSVLYPYRLLPVLRSTFTLCSQYQFFMHLFSFQPSSYKN